MQRKFIYLLILPTIIKYVCYIEYNIFEIYDV